MSSLSRRSTKCVASALDAATSSGAMCIRGVNSGAGGSSGQLLFSSGSAKIGNAGALCVSSGVATEGRAGAVDVGPRLHFVVISISTLLPLLLLLSAPARLVPLLLLPLLLLLTGSSLRSARLVPPAQPGGGFRFITRPGAR